MRSITAKLVLAFLGVSLASIVLIVFFARWSANEEFRKFLSAQDQANIASTFSDYYREQGSWAGVDEVTLSFGNLTQSGRYPFALVDNTGEVVFAGFGHTLGEIVSQPEMEQGIPIVVDENVVGTLLVSDAMPRMRPGGDAFLKRIDSVLLFSALGAALLALTLGLLLSRYLTRPIRELTAATRAISEGNLEQVVPVRSRDELGDLAASFNRMNADLARSLDLRRQMAADIAHELRTPISVILGHAEAVHDGVLPPSMENFEIIREEAGRLEHLVEDLRTLSRADAGELPIERQPVAPQKLLEDVRAIHSHRASQKNITVDVQAAPDLPEISVDFGRMIQVLSNLLDNALRYTPEGGQVMLSARQVGQMLEMRVQDSGPGLADDELAHIFDRFYRADASRQRDEGGSGLGLAIAKSLVEKHAGRIWAESRLGRGVTVVITIPI
ncbi:MAG: HAMP domain-containing protein [Chloroflexi bacterium]|nr:HAMP domain-containing protein [Chloroflexota bacterium]